MLLDVGQEGIDLSLIDPAGHVPRSQHHLHREAFPTRWEVLVDRAALAGQHRRQFRRQLHQTVTKKMSPSEYPPVPGSVEPEPEAVTVPVAP